MSRACLTLLLVRTLICCNAVWIDIASLHVLLAHCAVAAYLQSMTVQHTAAGWPVVSTCPRKPFCVTESDHDGPHFRLDQKSRFCHFACFLGCSA